MLGPGPLGTPGGAGFGAPATAFFPPSPYAAAAYAPPAAYAVPPATFAGVPSPYAAGPSPFAVAPSPFAAGPSPFAAAPSPFAAGPSPFAAGPSPFAAAPSPLVAPPGTFAVPPAIFAPPAPIAAERPVGSTYVETTRPTPQTLQALAGLLRQLEASIPLSEVLHSLHAQAMQIPEIAAQPAYEEFGKNAREALHAEIAAIGFIRRMLCGDWSAGVVQGVREEMRKAAKAHLEAQVAFKDVLARPTAAQHPVIQVLRQAVSQTHQVHRVAFGQAQVLGIAPLPQGEGI